MREMIAKRRIKEWKIKEQGYESYLSRREVKLDNKLAITKEDTVATISQSSLKNHSISSPKCSQLSQVFSLLRMKKNEERRSLNRQDNSNVIHPITCRKN